MSRALTPALKSAMAGTTHTLRRLLTITRRDGLIIRYTDSVKDLTIAGNLYSARPGFRTSALVIANDGSIPTFDLVLPCRDDFDVKPKEVLRGLWGGATVALDYCDLSTPSAGLMPVFEGMLGTAAQPEGGAVLFEVHGRLDLARTIFVESYGPTCRADLGDSRCKWPLLANGTEGTVEALAGRSVTVALSNYPPDGYFDGGVIKWTGGDNAGFAQEVRQWLVGPRRLSFWVTPRFTPKVGDAFTVYPGCNKLLSTCRDKFNNVANFQGEPYLPGSDMKLTFTTYRKETTTTTYVAEKEPYSLGSEGGWRINGALPSDVTEEDIQKAAISTVTTVEQL
jgi:uncharacterized phage protein (TIGR02218 family)